MEIAWLLDDCRFDYVSDVYAPTHSGKKDKCFITKSNDATSYDVDFGMSMV